MKRYVEHYLELYSKQNTVSDEAFNSLPQLAILEELDAMPTFEELVKAIVALLVVIIFHQIS